MNAARQISAATRLTFVWLVASALTVVSWVLAVAGRFNWGTVEALAVLAIAAVKVRLIAREFMEVRAAPPWLGRFVDAWIAVVFGTIVTLLVA